MSQSICLFGDSVAKGIGYDEASQRYIHTDHSFLRLFCAAQGLELLDHARFGCTLAKAQRLAETHWKDASESQATFFMLGGNDCDYDWAAVAQDPNPDRPCSTPMDSFLEGYLDLLARIKMNGGHPVLLSMVPVVSRKYYAWITARHGEAGIRQFLLFPEHIEHWNERYNLALYQIAGQSGVPLIDLRSPLLARKDIGDFYCPDGIHPNQAGHTLLFKACQGSLLHVLEQAPPYQ